MKWIGLFQKSIINNGKKTITNFTNMKYEFGIDQR